MRENLLNLLRITLKCLTPCTERFYHPKQRCRDVLVMTLLAVLWRFLCLHRRRTKSREAERERAGGLSPGCTWPRAVRMKPSPAVWLLLGLGNRTFVGKQDRFKDARWQYQFFFVTQNTLRPWILSSHLDRGTHSRLSLAPWQQPWGSADGLFSKSHGLGLFRKKSACCLSPDMLEGSKNRHGKSNGHSYCPGSSVDVGFSIRSD